MNRYKIILGYLIFITILLSCSIKQRMMDHSVNKRIKALSENEKGNIVYENGNAKIYFNKKDVINSFSNIKNHKWTSYCERIQIEEYETRIRNAINEVKLFNDFTDNNLDYCGDLHGRVLEELLLNHNFVIFNKAKNRYEETIKYAKWGNKLGCCFAGFYFLNNERFIMTRVFTDLIIVEDCDSIQKI